MQQTTEQLKDLKLTGLLEAWQEQQTIGTYHDLSFDERFALLVEREHIRRQNLRVQRRLKQAQLPVQATIEEVDFGIPRGLKKVQFLNLAQGQWVQDRFNLILMGPTGACHFCERKMIMALQ
ncbi:MAG: ATP-binding protein [Thermosynechococcaceae cyanobacterium]